ncbi:MAG: cytochrome c-type biogenesis protein CcmH [Alphaproteobacteria bacterium]
MTRLAATLAALLVSFLLLAAPTLAVQPDEVLADPALEARARALSADIRCLVCQNQSIDDSNAPLARDLRLLVRERLVAGDNDDQVLDFLVARYGEFVLLRPRFTLANLVLWITPALALLIAVGALWLWLGRRDHRPGDAAPSGDSLTPAEEARLAAMLAAVNTPESR